MDSGSEYTAIVEWYCFCKVTFYQGVFKHPTTRIPNSSSPPRHKNRHMAISREPRVVEYIRWCQNDRKNMKTILK